MRYFLISYAWDSPARSGFGNIRFSCAEFPSNESLKKEIICKDELSPIVRTCILSIFEFKSGEDYNNFQK